MSGILAALAGIKTAIATAVDEYFNRVTLLLNTSSTNGAQNNTFLDSSTNNFTITRNGNTTQGTFTPFSQTGWSYYFDGNINCDLQTPSNAAFGYGTGDFCLEAWVYQQTDANARIIDHTAGAFNFGLLSNGVVTLFDGTTTHSTATSLVPLNTWTHICATRQGSTLRLFVNGVLRYNTSFTVSKADSAVNIGSNPGSGGETLLGYISNLRIVKGGVPSAYSTSSTTNGTTVFTPSTTPLSASESLTAGSLSLLTCQSNRFVDNSANAFAISVTAGTPSVQAFSPFLPTAAYDTAVVGGSGYFDGSGDYLTGPNASGGDFSTGDFTISAWFYPTTLTGGTDYGIMSYADTGGWNGWQLQASGTNKNIKFEFLTGSAGASTITGGSIALNAWNYVAIVRSGSTVSMYVNSTTAATSTTNSTAYGAASSRVIVGADRSALSAFVGYISNSKLVKQANAPASIPTAPDTNTTNTSFLLNYTNAGIYDSASKNVLETVGNAQVSTTQAKWGTTSMYFDGTGDWLVSPYSVLNEFGSGNLTIEMWVRTSDSNQYTTLLAKSPSSFASGMWSVQINGATGSSGAVVVYAADNSTTTPLLSTTGASVIDNAWHHIAVVRNGSSWVLYIDGTSRATATWSGTIATLSGQIWVGADQNFGRAYTGYIDDLRITKGYARYTANFTAPTAAFPLQ